MFLIGVYNYDVTHEIFFQNYDPYQIFQTRDLYRLFFFFFRPENPRVTIFPKNIDSVWKKKYIIYIYKNKLSVCVFVCVE